MKIWGHFSKALTKNQSCIPKLLIFYLFFKLLAAVIVKLKVCVEKIWVIFAKIYAIIEVLKHSE